MNFRAFCSKQIFKIFAVVAILAACLWGFQNCEGLPPGLRVVVAICDEGASGQDALCVNLDAESILAMWLQQIQTPAGVEIFSNRPSEPVEIQPNEVKYLFIAVDEDDLSYEWCPSDSSADCDEADIIPGATTNKLKIRLSGNAIVHEPIQTAQTKPLKNTITKRSLASQSVQSFKNFFVKLWGRSSSASSTASSTRSTKATGSRQLASEPSNSCQSRQTRYYHVNVDTRKGLRRGVFPVRCAPPNNGGNQGGPGGTGCTGPDCTNPGCTGPGCTDPGRVPPPTRQTVPGTEGPDGPAQSQQPGGNGNSGSGSGSGSGGGSGSGYGGRLPAVDSTPLFFSQGIWGHARPFFIAGVNFGAGHRSRLLAPAESSESRAVGYLTYAAYGDWPEGLYLEVDAKSGRPRIAGCPIVAAGEPATGRASSTATRAYRDYRVQIEARDPDGDIARQNFTIRILPNSRKSTRPGAQACPATFTQNLQWRTPPRTRLRFQVAEAKVAAPKLSAFPKVLSSVNGRSRLLANTQIRYSITPPPRSTTPLLPVGFRLKDTGGGLSVELKALPVKAMPATRYIYKAEDQWGNKIEHPFTIEVTNNTRRPADGSRLLRQNKNTIYVYGRVGHYLAKQIQKQPGVNGPLTYTCPKEWPRGLSLADDSIVGTPTAVKRMPRDSARGARGPYMTCTVRHGNVSERLTVYVDIQE